MYDRFFSVPVRPTLCLVLILTLSLAPMALAQGPSAPQEPAAGALESGPAIVEALENDDTYPLDPDLFPVPDNLRPNVDFWIRIYSGHDNTTVLLHDELHLDIVYAAIDFSELEDSPYSEVQKRQKRREEIKRVRGKYRAVLQDLAAGRTSKSWPEEQARVQALFADVPGNRSKYSAALGRLRTQTCLRNRFAEAIERSGYYMDSIEAVFEERQLPRELTRIPFVESLFQWEARSAVAAGGIWQFMPSTGREFLEVELEMDERFDPLRATDAAARLLTQNFESLETWPLAITAYNHGRNGMRRAVKRLGTRDLGEIVDRYRSRTFGFASRNFYAEFIAATTVYERRDTLFPGVEPWDPLRFDELTPPRYTDIRELASRTDTDLSTLRKLNPGISREIWAGHLYWPARYPMRVPVGTVATFEEALEGLGNRHTASHQVGFRYRVRSGDSLSRIAGRFGTSVGALQRANKLSSPHRIRVGQNLLIPPARGGGLHPQAIADNGGVHVVRRGETLSRIAGLYGTSTQAMLAANGLASADHLAIGQRLQVPGSGSGSSADRPATHVVRSGETLASIARRYGTTVRAIKSANSLRNDLIRPRQKLVIP